MDSYIEILKFSKKLEFYSDFYKYFYNFPCFNIRSRSARGVIIRLVVCLIVFLVMFLFVLCILIRLVS